jgi:protein TonB
MALAEDSIEVPGWGRRLRRLALAGAAALLLAALAWWLANPPEKQGPPKRQVSTIAILPDRPPPPPPPPREEKPTPRDEPTPTVRDEAVKQAEAQKPANERTNMEGTAGDDGGQFGSGPVNRDYTGGTPGTGSPAAGAAGTASDRALERFFANSARQLLRDEIEKHLNEEVQQAQAEFILWVERSGAIQRFQLQPTGDARLDAELQAALDQTQRSLRLPIPPAALQPMKFRLSLRPQG